MAQCDSENPPSTVVRAIRRDGPEGGDLRAVAPAITIVWHHNLNRVGQSAALGLGRTEVSRFTAPFDVLTDTVLSRAPFLCIDHKKGAIVVSGTHSKTSVVVDGLPLTCALSIDPERLRHGVIVTLADAVVVCLHLLRTPVLRGPAFGLVGTSDAMEAVRRQVQKVADLELPVALRGESGTGKELVARAIASGSARPEPFVAVNMATIASAMAADTLFGHEKGAFTGAAEARPGIFAEADGGTLFLDEIAATPLDVQRMLLRVLETGLVRPLGSRKDRQVKVRLVTATDADLETAVTKGSFEGPLLRRIEGYRISLPPLAERREDIGSLFLHFLRHELAATAELERLEPCEPDERPWLAAADMARIARAQFPGNLRRLHFIANHVVISSRRQPFAHLDGTVEKLLHGEALPSSTRGGPRRAGQPSDEDIRDALARNGYNVAATTKELGIHRSTFYERARAAPGLIRMTEAIPEGDILDAYDRLEGDVSRMAAELRVSPKALKHRLDDALRGKR